METIKQDTALDCSLTCELLSLLDELASSQSDLEACGPASLYLLHTTIASLRQSKFSRARTIANSLLLLSDEKILSYNYKDVPTCWRRMYTDSVVLKSIGLLGGNAGRETEWLDAVRELDLVLIVAGAPGQGRERMVFELMGMLQRLLDPRLPSPDRDLRENKRIKIAPRLSAFPSPSPGITSPIPVLLSAPSLSSFNNLIQSGPFIIKGGCSDWDATSKWTCANYLKDVVSGGRGRVVPVEVGRDYTVKGWGQKIVGWEEFVDSLGFEGAEEDKEDRKMYLAQHDLFRQFRRLERDLVVPDYVYSLTEEQGEGKYEGPKTEEGFIKNAWLGPEGTLSPGHTDPYYNCYAQVVGHKWIWVAPPSASPSMYTFSSQPPLPSSDDGTDEEDEEDSSTSQYMTNTSRVDVTQDPTSQYFQKFPEFVANVVPVSQQAVLEPGDLLFMPPGWWHSMKSLSVSFSVSIWF